MTFSNSFELQPSGDYKSNTIPEEQVTCGLELTPNEKLRSIENLSRLEFEKESRLSAMCHKWTMSKSVFFYSELAVRIPTLTSTAGADQTDCCIGRLFDLMI